MKDLFVLLMMHPPSDNREFWCRICGVRLSGRTVTIDQVLGRHTCHDCTGREPDTEGT